MMIFALFNRMPNTGIIASYSNSYFTLLKSTVCANPHFKEQCIRIPLTHTLTMSILHGGRCILEVVLKVLVGQGVT